MRLRWLLFVLPAICLVIGLGSGAAYAYFTSSGHGSGSGSTGSMQKVTISSTTATPTSTLQPGSTADVTLEVTNPNSFSVTLVSVVGSGTITADASHPLCTTTGVTFTGQTSLDTPISAGATAKIDLPGAATMTAASSAGCQGATFSIPVTISVEK